LLKSVSRSALRRVAANSLASIETETPPLRQPIAPAEPWWSHGRNAHTSDPITEELFPNALAALGVDE
jgi:hypothetical protein